MIVSPVPAVAASENELERVVLDCTRKTVSVPLRNLQPENRSRYPYRKMGFHRLWIPVRYIRKKLLFIFCAADGICTSFRLTQPLQIIREFLRTVPESGQMPGPHSRIHRIHVLQLHTGCCIGSIDQRRITVKCFFCLFLYSLEVPWPFPVQYTLLRRM